MSTIRTYTPITPELEELFKANVATDKESIDHILKQLLIDLKSKGFLSRQFILNHSKAEPVVLQHPLHPDQRLNASEAATYTKLSSKTLANLRSNGKGPIFECPRGRVTYRVADLDVYLTAGRKQSTSDAGGNL